MAYDTEAQLTTLAGVIAHENGLHGNQAADLANELQACVDDFVTNALANEVDE